MAVGFSIQTGPDDPPSSPTRVRVSQRLGETATYRVRYPVEVVDGDLAVLRADALQPGEDLQVICRGDDEVVSLIKGPINGQHVHMEHGAANAWVDVYGEDTTGEMNRRVRHEAHDGSVQSVLNSILNRYFEVVQVGDVSVENPGLDRPLVQTGTDLRFVRRVSRQNGMWLHARSGPEGVNTARVEPMGLDGSTGAELVINYDDNNLEALDLYWDVDRPAEVVGRQVSLEDKRVFDTGTSPGSWPSKGTNLEQLAGNRRSSLVAAVDHRGALKARAEAMLEQAGWFIRARCTTTLHRLGEVVQVHDLVRLRGMGSRHDGRYFVTAVDHQIDAEHHRMEIELSRNRWDTEAA